MAFRDAFVTFPELHTARLSLRRLGPKDAAAYHAQQSSALALPGRPRWSFGDEMESEEKARASIRFANTAWQRQERLRWGLWLKDGNAVVGACQLFDFVNQRQAELSYWLGAAYHGQGLMTEAVMAVVAYAFDMMQLHRITAYTSTSNLASRQLLRKVGFREDGLLREHSWRDGVWDDSVLMTALRTDCEPHRSN